MERTDRQRGRRQTHLCIIH